MLWGHGLSYNTSIILRYFFMSSLGKKSGGGRGGTYVYISSSKSFNHFIDRRNRRAQRDKCHLTFIFKVTSCVSTFLHTVPSFTNLCFQLLYMDIKSISPTC